MSLLDQSLLDHVVGEADRIEAEGRIPEPLLSGLREANAFSLLLPAELGGRQLAYPDFLDCVQALARCDGSVGWCANQGSVLASTAYQLPQMSAEAIWTAPSVSIANGPPGRCVAVKMEGGYRLTGTWSFSSGIDHASHLIGVAGVRDANGDPTGAAKWCFFPKDAADVSPVWNVNGLKGTASFSFSVEDLLIPEDMTIEYRAQKTGPTLYRIPLNLLFACGFAAVALGVSRGALDFAIGRTKEKTKRFADGTLSLNESVQSQIGRAEAIWRMADSFLHSEAESVWTALEQGEPLGDHHRIAMRMAGTHVIRQCMDVTDIAYAVCSTDSIFGHNEIQRRFQDMHVITQHIQGRPEIYGILGKYYLGLPFEGPLIS